MATDNKNEAKVAAEKIEGNEKDLKILKAAKELIENQKTEITKLKSELKDSVLGNQSQEQDTDKKTQKTPDEILEDLKTIGDFNG